MTPQSLSPQAVSDIQSLIQEATSDRQAGLPCAAAVIVGDGATLAQDLFQDVDEDADIFWLASCTKLITSIACLQLVEKATLALDDADQVERLCPELRNVKVAAEDGRLVDKYTRITLRSFLTHTYEAGFGYSFLSPSLEQYAAAQGKPAFEEFSGLEEDIHQPLAFQPGLSWQYGISLDWAGILVQRATGQTLNDYMQQNIFQPLQIKDLTMFPDKCLQLRLAGIWQRDDSGKLSPRTFPISRALDETLQGQTFNSGGAGLYGSLHEYSKILVMLLNRGICPTTKARILQPETVKALFTNQIPEQPDFAHQPLPTCKPDLAHPAPAGLYPLCPAGKPQGWGLGAILSPSVTGRSDSTAHWCGLSNVFWWCDWEKKVAGVVGSQVLPFADPKAVKLWADLERIVYEDLNRE